MSVTEKADLFTIAQYGDIDNFIAKFDKSNINDISKAGSSLLHHAIAGRKYDIATYLVQNNINVNKTNADGQTALHLLCINPNIELAKLILDKGGNVNIRDRYGNNPMWSAVFNCKGKHYEIIELFMKYMPDINTKNNAGKSPLDFAKQVGNDKLINMLIL